MRDRSRLVNCLAPPPLHPKDTLQKARVTQTGRGLHPGCAKLDVTVQFTIVNYFVKTADGIFGSLISETGGFP
jgi:hypothetical protein